LEEPVVEPEQPCAECEKRRKFRQAVIDWAPVIAPIIVDVVLAIW
jgi:predicted nucleic acid-binding Zn ribbon protein